MPQTDSIVEAGVARSKPSQNLNLETSEVFFQTAPNTESQENVTSEARSVELDTKNSLSAQGKDDDVVFIFSCPAHGRKRQRYVGCG